MGKEHGKAWRLMNQYGTNNDPLILIDSMIKSGDYFEVIAQFGSTHYDKIKDGVNINYELKLNELQKVY